MGRVPISRRRVVTSLFQVALAIHNNAWLGKKKKKKHKHLEEDTELSLSSLSDSDQSLNNDATIDWTIAQS